jgi:hypothetical protein
MTRLDVLWGEWALAVARNDYKEVARLQKEISEIEKDLNNMILSLWPGAIVMKERANG